MDSATLCSVGNGFGHVMLCWMEWIRPCYALFHCVIDCMIDYRPHAVTPSRVVAVQEGRTRSARMSAHAGVRDAAGGGGPPAPRSAAAPRPHATSSVSSSSHHSIVLVYAMCSPLHAMVSCSPLHAMVSCSPLHAMVSCIAYEILCIPVLRVRASFAESMRTRSSRMSASTCASTSGCYALLNGCGHVMLCKMGHVML